MFTNISWQDYFIAVAITLTVYYLLIGIRFYSQEIRLLFSRRWRVKFSQVEPEEYQDSPWHQDPTVEIAVEDEMEVMETMISRLKDEIENASRKEKVPHELKHRLSLVLNEYPKIRNSAMRSSVNELIVSECEKYTSFDFTEEEVDRLWEQIVY